MGFGANLFLTPKWVTFKSYDELELFCIHNNLINDMKYNYDETIAEIDGSHTVKFYCDKTSWKDPRDFTQEEIETLGASV